MRGSQVGASRKMEESADGADFHTPSEYIGNVSRGENSPDHAVLNTGQETKEVVESDAGKDAEMDAAISPRRREFSITEPLRVATLWKSGAASVRDFLR